MHSRCPVALMLKLRVVKLQCVSAELTPCHDESRLGLTDYPSACKMGPMLVNISDLVSAK